MARNDVGVQGVVVVVTAVVVIVHARSVVGGPHGRARQVGRTSVDFIESSSTHALDRVRAVVCFVMGICALGGGEKESRGRRRS